MEIGWHGVTHAKAVCKLNSSMTPTAAGGTRSCGIASGWLPGEFDGDVKVTGGVARMSATRCSTFSWAVDGAPKKKTMTKIRVWHSLTRIEPGVACLFVFECHCRCSGVCRLPAKISQTMTGCTPTKAPLLCIIKGFHEGSYIFSNIPKAYRVPYVFHGSARELQAHVVR